MRRVKSRLTFTKLSGREFVAVIVVPMFVLDNAKYFMQNSGVLEFNSECPGSAAVSSR